MQRKALCSTLFVKNGIQACIARHEKVTHNNKALFLNLKEAEWYASSKSLTRNASAA